MMLLFILFFTLVEIHPKNLNLNEMVLNRWISAFAKKTNAKLNFKNQFQKSISIASYIYRNEEVMIFKVFLKLNFEIVIEFCN